MRHRESQADARAKRNTPQPKMSKRAKQLPTKLVYQNQNEFE